MTSEQIANALGHACIGIFQMHEVLILAQNMAMAMNLTNSELLEFTNKVLAAYL